MGGIEQFQVEISSLADVIPAAVFGDIEAYIIARGAGIRDGVISSIPQNQGFEMMNCRIDLFPTLRYKIYNPSHPTDPSGAPLPVVEIFVFPEDYTRDIGSNRCRIYLAPSESRNWNFLGSNIFQNTIGVFTDSGIGFCDLLEN